MNGRLAFLSLWLLGAAAQADPRITTHFYQPSDVVTLHGRAGIETTIAFADDEHIENIAVGNSAAWQVIANKRANLLFVKPAGARARTNMTVVTDRHTYLFDLVSMAGKAPVYMLRFTYPAAPKPPIIATPVAVAEAVVTLPAAPPPRDPAELSFAWRSAGDRRLLPARSFDDGHSTFLQWPKEATLPAILEREATGLEGPVNFTVRGEYIVVDGVPAQLILRAGKQMATLTPDPRPARAEPSGGVSASAVTVQTASAKP